MKTKYPNQEQQWKDSDQDVRTRGQGETDGEHLEPGEGKYSLNYQYLNSGSAVKQPTLK